MNSEKKKQKNDAKIISNRIRLIGMRKKFKILDKLLLI